MMAIAWISIIFNLLMLGFIISDKDSNGGGIIIATLFLTPSIAIAMAVIMGVV